MVSLLICSESFHFIIFYLIYELSMFVLLPVLTIASRSYRKQWALTALYIVVVIGSITFYLTLTLDLLESQSHTTASWSHTSIAVVLLAILTIAKIPTYPLHFWLPEAHVEATWSGSIVLACILLKYSLYSCLMFLQWSLFTSISLMLYILVGISVTVATMYIAISSDLKKIGAYLSVLHMNLGVYILVSSGQLSSLSTDMLWSAHSLTAYMYFWWLGQAYSISGTRTVQSHPASSSLTPLAILLTLQVLILNIAIPLGPLYYPELSLLAVLPTVMGPLHIASIVIVLIVSVILLISLLLRTCMHHDTKAVYSDLSLQQLYIALVCIIWDSILASV
jgi:NADH:ubiquinone oxidoreductase subunit 4 (subunit M)